MESIAKMKWPIIGVGAAAVLGSLYLCMTCRKVESVAARFAKTLTPKQISALEEKAEQLMKKMQNYEVLKYDDPNGINSRISKIMAKESKKYDTTKDYKIMYSLIDYTTLDITDTRQKVEGMVAYVNEFHETNPTIPNVAALCVYPPFVSIVRQNLTTKGVSIASVAGSFPSSQASLDTKLLEVKHCLDDGADEIDIVLPVGKFHEKKYAEIFKEISCIKTLCGNKRLKVILEVDALGDINEVYNASMLAMDAGADFIKTSTGKVDRKRETYCGKLLTMCDAIKDFNLRHNCKVAIKPAGGMKTYGDALGIYSIVIESLGPDYQDKKLFRLGASSLLKSLYDKIKSDPAA